MQWRRRWGPGLMVMGVASVFGAPAARAAVGPESAYLFNTLLLLIGGFLVMWMAAGFAMLEAGLVRSKNVATICLKNVGLYAIACLMYYLVGFALMYEGVDGGVLGSFALFAPDDAAALHGGDFSAGHAKSAEWFFQVVFVATAASIVSGTLAERIRILPFFFFVAVLSAFIYPIEGAWTWGGGWLAGRGFSDFAGSTIVHSAGGWAALAGSLILGPRLGRYGALGEARAMPGSNLPLATLGTFILWVGWFGFNGASQLAFADAADAVAVSRIFANTNMAAVGGVLAAIAVTRLRYGRVDLTMALNGALAGLVSITAEPSTPTVGQAVLIGAVGGTLVVLLVPLLDRLHIDDVVGAIPVHLGAGIWGTLAAALTNPDVRLVTQLGGILAIGAFVFLASAMVWLALRHSTGLRLSPEDEFRGGDVSELGLEAYPEFGRGSQAMRD